MNNPSLTIPLLIQEAQAFAILESLHQEPLLYGVTDGKAVGTYLEHKFQLFLQDRYEFTLGNSAEGIDLSFSVGAAESLWTRLFPPYFRL